MSVVVNMPMPAKCNECDMRFTALARCAVTGKSTSHSASGKPLNENKRPSWCPIVAELPAEIGDTLYFAGYDENFPDKSDVEEHEVIDVSVGGLVQTDDLAWENLDDVNCWLYRTREEAIQEIRNQGGYVEDKL